MLRWMDQRLLFCADSAAASLETPKLWYFLEVEELPGQLLEDLHGSSLKLRDFLRADFREEDEDRNFSACRVRRFSEWPEPLHWIAFPVEILTKPLIHWIAAPLFIENPFFSLKSASSHPLPRIGSERSRILSAAGNSWDPHVGISLTPARGCPGQKLYMQGASFCCFRQGRAVMSCNLGWDVPWIGIPPTPDRARIPISPFFPGNGDSGPCLGSGESQVTGSEKLYAEKAHKNKSHKLPENSLDGRASLGHPAGVPAKMAFCPLF